MQVDDAQKREATYSGATLHEEYTAYVQYPPTIPEQKIIQDLYDQLSVAIANGDNKHKTEVMQELSIMRDSVVSKLMNYKPDAGRSQAAAALVYDQTSIHGIEEKKFAISLFDSTFLDSYYLNKMRQEIKTASKSQSSLPSLR